MALAAALTVLMALLPAGLASESGPKPLTVTCTEEGSSQQQIEVTAAGTVLTVECPKSWTIHPLVKSPQKVYGNDKCTDEVLLTSYAPEADAVAVNNLKPGMKITFKQLPPTTKAFYLNCKNGSEKACPVKVILNKPTTGPSGTPSVQICKQPNASITLKIPEKGSSAQFACEEDFYLYPTEADKVFSKDCKTKETLSDMKRTETPAAGTAPGSRSQASPTYTLEANKKPSKKTLCYLCAKKGTTEKEHGTAENYCTIYVQSGARTQLDLIFTFVLAFPCVLAAFHFG